ncbi:MAG: hypothetical protein IJP31_10570 [Lachnospiraceae bacterium]|nr:hypothetical protein [Lachnospiraceae bacterium]
MKLRYKKIVDFWDAKKVGITVAVIFFLSLLPIIYVGFFNYATGDDYWYGIHTYRGLVEEGIVGALKGSLQTVAEFYQSWQGTWFTMFLFTLSPNHFWEHGYVSVVFLALFLLIGSVVCLGRCFLVKKLGFSKGAVSAIVCMILYLMLQYIPSTASGIYWFNGIIHYLVPFFLGALAVVYTQKWVEEKKKKDFLILFICFTLLGGGSYLVPLSATLAACLILTSRLEIQEFSIKEKKIRLAYDWHNLWILTAFAAEGAGLLCSFLSPGNSIRGGEEFGFSLKWALECIYYAIDRGIYLGEDYFKLNPVTTIIYLLLAVILWQQMWKVDKEKYKFRFPLLFVIYLNGIYWAGYVPEIYSRSDVSGGVPNTYFHLFLLVTLGNMIYVHGWLQRKLWIGWKKKAASRGIDVEEYAKTKWLYGDRFRYFVSFPVILAGILALVATTQVWEVRTTSEYCLEAIAGGQLEKYADVRREQHSILSSSTKEAETVPEMEAPYPLLNMLLSESEEGSHNIDRELYYQIKSISTYRVD